MITKNVCRSSAGTSDCYDAMSLNRSMIGNVTGTSLTVSTCSLSLPSYCMIQPSEVQAILNEAKEGCTCLRSCCLGGSRAETPRQRSRDLCWRKLIRGQCNSMEISPFVSYKLKLKLPTNQPEYSHGSDTFLTSAINLKIPEFLMIVQNSEDICLPFLKRLSSW